MYGGMLQHEVRTEILGQYFYLQVFHVPAQFPADEDQFVVEVAKYSKTANPVTMRTFNRSIAGNQILIREVQNARKRKYRELKKERDKRETARRRKKRMPK